MESQIKRVKVLLLDKKYPFVTVHALGAAIGHAIILATQVRERIHDHEVVLETDISTTTVHDDVVPSNEEQDIWTNSRKTPTIAIKISLRAK
ncbi:hypothetical protein EV182_004045 [Spiromyces aspiralis]|uniref:Uncharacterized protein n=1 Tax=Spiromyces aspiralis TaxID=68401 RepID=A0ACC1HRP7_9FUNG|nr:hypothetical protein EV182_004045 [Spiromyces aspiralis]